MPLHPLHDLAWQVDELVRIPTVRERFISKILFHIDCLLDPSFGVDTTYGKWFPFHPQPQRGYLSRGDRLGWVTEHEDGKLFLPEIYATLGALRECVYKGRDRLQLCGYGPLPSEWGWQLGCPPIQKTWDLLIEVVNDLLTNEHRNYVESWIRDVRVDLELSGLLEPRAATSSKTLISAQPIDRPATPSALGVEKNAFPNSSEKLTDRAHAPQAENEVPREVSGVAPNTSHVETATPLGKLPDGPQEGCRVVYDGKTIPLKGCTYSVVAFFWTRQSATFDAIKEAINEDALDKTVNTWAHRANGVLASLGVPWKLEPDRRSRHVTKRPRA